MFSFPRSISAVIALSASLCFAGVLAAQSNSFVSDDTTTAATTTTPTAAVAKASRHPKHEHTVPVDKRISANVTRGILSVDGLVAKVQLNYDIHHAGYLYFFVPGVGTAIVSRDKMPNATRIKDALDGSEVAFTISGHSVDLSSDTPIFSDMLLHKRPEKMDAYVILDASTQDLNAAPMFGFGKTLQAPYTWPLSAPPVKDTSAHFVQPPPVPASMLPRTQAKVDLPPATH